MLCALNNKSVAETLIFVAALVVFRLGHGHGAQTADTETAAAAAEDLEVGESQYVLRTSYPGGAAGAGAAAGAAGVSTTVHHHQTYHTSGPPQYGKEPGYSVHFRKEYYDPRATCSTHFGQSGTCKPLVSCTIHYTELVGALQTPCYLPDGMVGVCCQDQTPAPYAPNNDILLEVKGRKPIRFPKISPYELASAIKAGQKELEEVVWLERELFKKNVVVARETSASYHQKFFTTTPEALAMGFNANKNLETCKQLINRFSLSRDQALFGLPSLSAKETTISDTCPTTPSCNRETRYRTIDGSCNNLENPNWGRARTAMQRILEPDYADGLYLPRTSKSSRPLPSPRHVSASVVADVDRPFRNLTLMVMQWGQFLDHDLTHTPIAKGENQSGIKCCDEDGRTFIRQELRHPACLPIEIPRDDAYYARHGQICMEFVRSLPAPRDDCSFGARQQMNQITAFIDASNVYASNEQETRELRTLRGGRLKVTKVGEKDLLPLNTDMMDECTDPQRNLFCFKAGDARVNEQVELTTMHTLWMREHNRVADEMAKLNPYWDDETIFQETRRIVAAEMQHITYNEWLPIVLGSHFMQNYSLHSQPSGFTYQYDSSINPSITNAFSAAALRFGHTLIQGFLQMWNKFGSVSRVLELHDHFFKPFELYRPESYDGFLRGLANQPCQQYDQFFTESVVGRLFQPDRMPFGMDLVALNIQRGRDHGIPSYNEYRAECGLKRAQDFQDLSDFISWEAINNLKQMYESVDDIDLFIGGILERPLFEGGGTVGPTFTCILGDQFARLKRGDRFYYEEGNQAGSFTLPQLESLRTVSLARVICDNGDDIQAIQPLVFFQYSDINPRVPCSSYAIPRLDLRLWQAELPAHSKGAGFPQPNGW